MLARKHVCEYDSNMIYFLNLVYFWNMIFFTLNFICLRKRGEVRFSWRPEHIWDVYVHKLFTPGWLSMSAQEYLL